MKNMRKLVPAFAMLMVAAIMMSTASFAWFTMGTKATADGMVVKATASSSLVIDNVVTNLTSADQTVSFTTSAASLEPATHDDSFTSKLGKPADNQGINAGTGIMDAGNSLVEATSGCYFDYVVYIATTGGAAMNDQTLSASVTVPKTLANYIHNAVTIDFWVATYTDDVVTEASAYKTKVNFKDVVAGGTEITTDYLTLKIPVATALDIPLLIADETDTSLSYIAVTMRVYFDGDLRDGANCYIRNTKASVAEAGFSVDFSCE